MFSYTHPRLSAGQSMTDELAKAMPSSFFYRFFRDGSCALAQNTYLGHDYMGATGRFGNYMSHVIVFQKQLTQQYPCEFWESPMLRRAMKYEEVNDPNVPAYLPEPTGEPGSMISVASIKEFLGQANRLEIYKHMLAALLYFRREKKRVVIIDEAENIIFWIAALEYALPLSFAQRLNFNTYEYNPDTSQARICGVLEEGTKFSVNNAMHHYVFDLKRDCYPKFPQEEFLDFVLSGFLDDNEYDELKIFHRYLEENFTFHLANDKLYDAYRLYLMMEKHQSMDIHKLDRALTFANEYGNNEFLERVIPPIMDGMNGVNDLELFLCLKSFFVQAVDRTGWDLSGQLKGRFANMIIILFTAAKDGTDFKGKMESLSENADKLGLNIDMIMHEDQTFAEFGSITLEQRKIWQRDFFIERLQSRLQHGNSWLDEITAECEKVIFNVIFQALEEAKEIGICRYLLLLLSHMVKDSKIRIENYYYPFLRHYYDRLNDFDRQKSFKYKVELLEQTQNSKRSIEYVANLISDILSEIPFKKLDRELMNIIGMADDCVNSQQIQPPSRLCMLKLGCYLQNCKTGHIVWDELAHYSPLIMDGQEENIHEYFVWIIPDVVRIFAEKKSLDNFIDNLKITKEQEETFRIELHSYYDSKKKINQVKSAMKNVFKSFTFLGKR